MNHFIPSNVSPPIVSELNATVLVCLCTAYLDLPFLGLKWWRDCTYRQTNMFKGNKVRIVAVKSVVRF